MRSIKELIDEMINQIKADSFFDEIGVFNAYPYMTKPDNRKPIIAISFGNIDFKPRHIGENSVSGDVSVFVDVYVPYKSNSSIICDIFSKLCLCFDALGIRSISSQRVVGDTKSESYLLKSSFTFDRELMAGGESGE